MPEPFLEQQHGASDAGAVQVPRRDQAVTAVVPLAADDDRTPAVRAAQEPQRGVGDLAAGGFHQAIRGDPTLPRRAIQLRRLRGCEDVPHPATATANATALVLSWVNVISTFETPSVSALTLALPSSRIAGAPEGALDTEMSCHRLPR